MARPGRSTERRAHALVFAGLALAALAGCGANTGEVVSSLPGISRFQYDGYDLLLERAADTELLLFVGGRRVDAAKLRQGGSFTLTDGRESTCDYQVLLIQPEHAKVKSETYDDRRLTSGKVQKRSGVLTVPWYGEAPVYEPKPDPFAPGAAGSAP